jgi:putative oxidoreductase
MKQLLFHSTDDWTGFILRMTAGFIMLPHGLQKSFGLFGGFGFKASMDYFTETMKLPWIISIMVIMLETLGPLGLIAGAFSRFWATALIIIMAGAIITTNVRNGLFMNWYGTQGGEGFEYHLLFIGICMAILFCGSGKFSIDKLLVKTN